jgi:hypothetical protein
MLPIATQNGATATAAAAAFLPNSAADYRQRSSRPAGREGSDGLAMSYPNNYFKIACQSVLLDNSASPIFS